MNLFPRELSRRHFLFGGALGGLGYMHFVETEWLGVGRHSLQLSATGARNPLTILQLSDLHASEVVSLRHIDRAVTLGLSACQPDLICLTGDFITSRYEDWEGYSRILARLPKVAPTVAILGNHDAGDWAVAFCNGYADHEPVAALLAKAGIRLLHNEQMIFAARDRRINLVGLGDLYAGEMQPRTAFANVDDSLATVLLSHNPDTKDELGRYPWNLMLSGHTHGGQLYLPGIGTPFAPVRDQRYVEGLKPWEDRWIHVTKGVGNLHGMRLNCRPEISVLTLT